jgi:hypothetical protein
MRTRWAAASARSSRARTDEGAGRGVVARERAGVGVEPQGEADLRGGGEGGPIE